MAPNPQQPKRQGGVLSSLNVAIDAMNLAKEVMDITPAKAAFGAISIILTMIKVRFLLVPVGRLVDNEYRILW